MHIPRRVVSLSPNVSMILFALGVDEVVVGRTQDCLPAIQHYLRVWRIPEHTVARRLRHWQGLPVVGAWPLADRESVKTLQPEAVLTSGSGPFGVHEAQTFGVVADALCHFDTRTLHDLEQHIQQIGVLLSATAEAARVTAQLARRRDEARARQRERSVPPTAFLEYCVCIQYDADPDRRIADPARAILVGGHLAPDLIQLSGGASLFTQPGDTAKWVAFDEIRAAQPDIILQFDCHGCPTARKHPIPRRPGWSELAAVSRAAVYPLSANISDPNLCFPTAFDELEGILSTYMAQNPTFKG
jgi:ABC-type Fe3+-hydroxamate transport system substrate-binding protein